MKRVLLLLGAVAVLVAPRAFASDDIRIDFDPQKTVIEISVADFLHAVHGVFHLQSGSLQFDRRSGAARGSIIVDAGSGDTGVGARDSKVRRDILEADRFPEIVFIPKNVVGAVPDQGSATVAVRGVFRIHGSDHDMTLTVPLRVSGSKFELTTTFHVPYVAWGMKDPSTLFMRAGKDVAVTVRASGQVRY